VHVTHVIHPDAGGPPTVAVNLAAAQARLGHTVTVLGHYPRADEATSQAMFDHVPFHVSLKRELFPLQHGWANYRARKFRHALHRLLPATDILIAHGMWYAETIHGASMAHRARVPYVLRPAGMLDPWSLRQKPLKKMLGLRFLYGNTLRNAAFIHATTQEEAHNIERIANRCRASVPIEIIPNGIFLNDIDSPPIPGCFYADHPELRHRPYIAFLSRLHHKKRADLLLRAFRELSAKLPQLQLVIAGPDDGELANLLRLSTELQLTDRVHFIGPLYGPKKFEFFADAACFCLPSEQENFGVAVAEAMAAGVPVVVSDQVQIWPEIEQRRAGKVCKLDIDSLAATLADVLQDEPARIAMGQAGRELTKDLFLWRNIALRSTEHYAHVIARRSPQPMSAAPPFNCL
jgi:glycosyltransferase involved in cell wall biosynthesis